jgi:predicted 3-demethylubiquinone-9 3-methyltransferase (glyoxalase superfamily)
MQKISPCLWFDGQAEDAAKFYVSIFKNSRIVSVTRWGDTGPGVKGTVLVVYFELEGQSFIALNGGPEFHFTPAISLSVDCQTQDEVDALWAKLTEGGAEVQCGWLTDKFGISWQIVPRALVEMLRDKNPAKADAAMRAMMPMKKLDIAALKRAFDRA